MRKCLHKEKLDFIINKKPSVHIAPPIKINFLKKSIVLILPSIKVNKIKYSIKNVYLG